MYEKTIEACLRYQSSQWDIGDALLEECKDEFTQLLAVLTERGLDLSPRYLRIMRDVARIFPPDVRTPNISWSVYREYLTHSEALLKWIEKNPGKPITVAKAKEHVSWLIHKDDEPAPVEDTQFVPDPVPGPSLDFDVLQRRAEDALEETWSVSTDLIEFFKNHEDELPDDWKVEITKLAEDARDKLSELLRHIRPKSGGKRPAAFTVVSSEARI